MKIYPADRVAKHDMNASASKRLRTAWALLLALDVAIQVTMKLAGDQLHAIPFGFEWVRAAFWSGMVWISLIGYATTFFLWLAILRSSALSAAFPTTALVYALVPLCGWILLGEDFKPRQTIGIALILGGVLLQRDIANAHQLK